MNKLILLGFIVAVSTAKYTPVFSAEESLQTVPLKSDHFNETDYRFFQCRYRLDLSNYNHQNGTVFMHMGGEGPLRASSSSEKLQNRAVHEDLSQAFSAANLYLEHRYYGESFPVEDLSVENLQLLTVEQALADVYEFIKWVQNSGLISKSSPVITIGGSYSGAMSAWFRHTYPDFTVGAWASGAVINGIIENWQMDHQTFLSTMKSGLECPANIQTVTKYVEEGLQDDQLNSYFKTIFNVTYLTDDEFLFMLADTFLETVQYGSRTKLCNVFTSMCDLHKQIELVASGLSTGSDALSFYSAKHTALTEIGSGMDRQWWWEKCNQVAYMQIANPDTNIAMRSTRINTPFFKQFCATSFGEGVYPNGDFNLKFGGANINATNIFFADGNEDPWKQDMLLEGRGSLYLYIVPGVDKGHCVDMNDPIAQGLFTAYAQGWVQEHYQKLQN